jgi:hypothetical protein
MRDDGDLRIVDPCHVATPHHARACRLRVPAATLAACGIVLLNL